MIPDRPPSLDARPRRNRLVARITIVGVVFLGVASGYGILEASGVLEQRAQLFAEQALEAARQRDRARDELSKVEGARARVLDLLVRPGEAEPGLVDAGVDWERTKASVLGLDAGPRQDAVVRALLVAWKTLPFPLGGGAPPPGIDSTRFVVHVLDAAGVKLDVRPGERPCAALARTFQATAEPSPGDLVVYRGARGDVALMYLGPGAAGGHGICVGAVEAGARIRILDSAHLDAAEHRFLAYHRVAY